VLQKDVLNGDGARIEYDLEEGAGDNTIRPMRHEYGQFLKNGEGLMNQANKEFHEYWKGEGEKKFQPVTDVQKFIHGDSDGPGVGDMIFQPVSDAFKWIRGDAEGGGARAGKLVLRIRKATIEDITFMERLAAAQKDGISGVYAQDTFVSLFRIVLSETVAGALVSHTLCAFISISGATSCEYRKISPSWT